MLTINDSVRKTRLIWVHTDKNWGYRLKSLSKACRVLVSESQMHRQWKALDGSLPTLDVAGEILSI